MNELQTLRDVWPAPDDRSRARQVARDRLLETVAAGNPAGRRPVGKFAIGIAAAAAVAAGAIVAVSAGGAPTTARAPSALTVDGVLDHAALAASETTAPPATGFAYTKYLSITPTRRRTVVEEWDSLTGNGSDEQLINGRREIAPAGRFTDPNLSYDRLLRLPTDPATLVGYVQRQAHPRGVLLTLTQLATQPSVPPRLRVAAFRALASQARTTVLRDAPDPVGRHGVAITFEPGAGYAETVVFDRRTYAFLGSFIRVPAATDGNGAKTVTISPAGTAELSVLRTGFVSTGGELP